jgi:predicted NUDIX family NTP pyrophosphohydrolase
MDEYRAHILLLIKQKGPAFLLGKDNFPGGKLEEGEDPSRAVIRECSSSMGTASGIRSPLCSRTGSIRIEHAISESTIDV